MKNRWIALAGVVLCLASATSAFAQDKMEGDKMKGDKMPAKTKMEDKGKMKAKGPVYVCKECKMGFSAAEAKKMKYKDGMGHKMAKMTKMPAGYKMSDGKMKDGKM